MVKIYKFMSVLRDIGVFLLSSLFTFALLTLVTTQTLGDSLQKENLKAFAESRMSPELMENQCEEECLKFEGITEDNLIRCTEQCLESVEIKREETNVVIDQLYEQEFMGQSLNDALLIMNQTFLFFALTVVSSALILVVSKNPLSVLGKDIVSISSITLLISLLLPDLVLMFSNMSGGNIVSDYLGQGLEKMMVISIILIAVGIALIITNYFLKRRKKKDTKKGGAKKRE